MAYSESFKTLIIANTAEAFSAPIGYIRNPKQRLDRIRVENVLSQRAIFWEGDDKIVVTPTPIDPQLLEFQRRSLGLNNIINISPEYKSHSLCRNIIEDSSFLEMLVGFIQDNRDIQLTAYSYTRELDNLVKIFTARGVYLGTPEKPFGNPSIVELLDSKSGFRQTLTSSNGVLLPEGYVCNDEEKVMDRAMDFKKNNRPFVIKANEGESG